MSDRIAFDLKPKAKLWLPYAIMALVAFLIFIMPTIMKKPTLPIPYNVTYGCYHSDVAPSIRLDEQRMQILQEGFPSIPYHLERHKTGIVLTAERPIQATANGERYEYSVYHPGVGTFLPFYRDVGGRRYGVFETKYLSGFSVYPRSFASGHSGYIVYVKSASDDC